MAGGYGKYGNKGAGGININGKHYFLKSPETIGFAESYSQNQNNRLQ
ncbi:hypothetical protein FACS189491_08140 [Spirochaetia bacterium]|nr:hypothetical protein FACS189491_08140 [Spirochaetia bacterium]